MTAGTEFDYAPGWTPDPGDVVKGEVIELTEYAGGGYGSYPIITLRNGDGEVALHAFHTALRNQFAELNVQPGDEIGVLYKGKVEKKDGSGSYESYRVKRLNQGSRGFDWGNEREAALEDPTPDDIHRPLDIGEEETPPF